MSDEDDFYELYDDIPRHIEGVVTAINHGGGQCCDTAGVLRALAVAGFLIVKLRNWEKEAARILNSQFEKDAKERDQPPQQK